MLTPRLPYLMLTEAPVATGQVVDRHWPGLWVVATFLYAEKLHNEEMYSCQCFVIVKRNRPPRMILM